MAVLCGHTYPRASRAILSSHCMKSTTHGVSMHCDGMRGLTSHGTSPKLVLRVMASHHTTGGSVDRNDAAPTGPLARPSPESSLLEAVRIQMDALSNNDKPRPDHGLEVMYYFANTEGTLSGSSLPRYFGFASDLYHFGHFALKFRTRYPQLLNHVGYEIVQLEEAQGTPKGRAQVMVTDKCLEQSTWMFTMSKQPRGQKMPCWLTDCLLKVSQEEL